MGPQTYDHLKKAVRVAVVVTMCVLTLAMIKSVAHSLPGKITFSALFCRNSSDFD